MNEFLKRLLSSFILIPISLFVIVKGGTFFNIFIFISFFLILHEWNNMKKNKLINILGIIFLIISFFTIYKLRNSFDGEYFYFIFITFICIFTDVGGYIVGKIFKGPKLTKLSPNKTYSGMIGSYLFSILFTLIVAKTSIFFNDRILINLNTLMFVFIISSISQFGDILISYFKRLSDIKDTGNLIPGDGGLLDRIDGMIFAFPISYFLLTFKIFLV